MLNIDRFIPIDRRRALATGDDLPHSTSGAGIFADISGFTSITEMLTDSLGAEYGAEEITACLNGIFDVLVQIVHRYGGCIISFSGDAITCWFENDNGLRATSCALSMRQAMEHHEVTGSAAKINASFGIKVAVAVGNARRFIVGLPSIQKIDVLVGDVLDELSSMEKLLECNEVAVSATCAENIGELGCVLSWQDISPDCRIAKLCGRIDTAKESLAIEPSTLDEPTARAWLLPPIHDRVLYDGQHNAELRSAAVFFLNFRIDKRELGVEIEQKLGDFVDRMQEILYHYEGFLHQVMIGDKGSYLYGGIGVPIAHEDDAPRSVAAAMELRNAIFEYSFVHEAKIGITFGEMYAGIYGGATRYTYGLIGNDVNMAARLMELAAAGEILVTGRVKRASESRFEFLSAGRRWLKGVKIPLEVFSVQGRKSLRKEFRLNFRFSERPMVNRSNEKLVLSDHIRSLENGKSGSIAIEGEAGIGKSRILEYLIKQALSQGIYVFHSVCEAVEMNSPYYAWRDIFNDVFDLTGDMEPGLQRELVLDWLSADSEILEMIPLIGEALAMNWPDNELTQQMKGDVRATNIRATMLRVLEEHHRRKAKTVIIFDDAQWMDFASWELLRDSRERIEPQLQVIAIRSHDRYASDNYKKWSRDAGTICLDVRRLKNQETDALICDCLGAEAVTTEFSDFMLKRAGGNPLFSQELAYTLRDRGFLEIDAGRYTLSTGVRSVDRIALPDTLQGLITSRFDTLSTLEQSVLKTCSAIDRGFSVEMLVEVHRPKLERSQIAEAVNKLFQANILQHDPVLLAPSFTFKHLLVQDAAHELMLYSQRRELHRRLAEWYEANYENSMPAHFSVLAHHWKHADSSEKAAKYYQEAGEDALQQFANREAAAFFEASISLLTDDHTHQVDARRLALLELRLGQALVDTFQNDEGRVHLEHGLLLLGKKVPSAKFAQIASLLAQVLQQTLYRIHIRRNRHVAPERTDIALEIACAYERLVTVYYFAKDTLRTLLGTLLAINAAEVAGPSPVRCRGYVTAGTIMGFIPLRRAAGSYIGLALREIAEMDDPSAKAYINMTASMYSVGIAEWDKTEVLLDESLAIAKRLGDYERDLICSLIQAYALLFQGLVEDALNIAEYVNKKSDRQRSLEYVINALEVKSTCLFQLGRFTEALDCLRRLPPLFSDKSVVFEESDQLVTYGLLAVTYLRLSDYDGALKAADQASDYAKKTTPDNYGFFWGFAGPVEVYLTLLERRYARDDVRKKARQALGRLKSFARVFPVAKPRSQAMTGLQFAVDGKKKSACRLWTECVKDAEEYRIPYDAALAHMYLGRDCVQTETQRNKHLAESMRLFEKIGAVYERQRIHEML